MKYSRLKGRKVWTCGCCWETDQSKLKTVELKNLVFEGHKVESAILGLMNDIKTKDLEADNIKDARCKMCELIKYWFPDVVN